MIEQVEELKPELQLGLLAQLLRQAPVLVEGKVHITRVRGVALSSLARRCLAKNVTVHSEGVRVEVLQIVSAEAAASL